MDTFRFRLNCLDNYQATPTDLDPALRRGTGFSQKAREASPQVPVIRAFGATETGQKVCAHIHGALPYLYLEYTGSLEKDVGRFIGKPSWVGAETMQSTPTSTPSEPRLTMPSPRHIAETRTMASRFTSATSRWSRACPSLDTMLDTEPSSRSTCSIPCT